MTIFSFQLWCIIAIFIQPSETDAEVPVVNKTSSHQDITVAPQKQITNRVDMRFQSEKLSPLSATLSPQLRGSPAKHNIDVRL